MIEDFPDGYKYSVLWVNATWKAYEKVTTKILQRVRQALKNQLKGKNNIQTTNTYPLLVIRQLDAIFVPPKVIKSTDMGTKKF